MSEKECASNDLLYTDRKGISVIYYLMLCALFSGRPKRENKFFSTWLFIGAIFKNKNCLFRHVSHCEYVDMGSIHAIDCLRRTKMVMCDFLFDAIIIVHTVL